MGIINIENCSFCKHYLETILHLFCLFRHVHQFLRSFLKWLDEEFQNIFSNRPKEDIIFGNRWLQISSNIIVLLAKDTFIVTKLEIVHKIKKLYSQ